MPQKLTDAEFLKLKNAYYSFGVNPTLPRLTVDSVGTPGKANNREQNALRWGYDRAMKDIGQHIMSVLLHRGA